MIGDLNVAGLVLCLVVALACLWHDAKAMKGS